MLAPLQQGLSSVVSACTSPGVIGLALRIYILTIKKFWHWNQQLTCGNTSGATNCFPPQLIGFIDELRTRFGNVSINSAYRSASRNRRVGGARRSQHINCNAIDFAVPGVSRHEVKEFLTANFRGRAGVGSTAKPDGQVGSLYHTRGPRQTYSSQRRQV